MIVFSIPTKKQGCCLKLLLEATPGCTIVIKGFDHVNKGMVYFRLVMDNYDHKGPIFLPMPLTPMTMTISIGVCGKGQLKVKEKKIIPLKTTPIPSAYTNEKCLDLFRFVQNISVISYFAPCWHTSCQENLIKSKNNPNACVQILPEIIDRDENGRFIKVSSTPARVTTPDDTNPEDFVFIEINQQKRKKMTVYMCVAMLLHELGHYLCHTEDEQASDRFSRMIYFALGYPKSEYLYSFTDVFAPIRNADGSVNKEHDRALGERLIQAGSDISQMEQKYY